MQQRRALLLLAVGLTALVLAGCGGGDENPANGGGEGGGGNNVIGNNNCTSGATCKQVTIGTQVWMAENLNIATSSGSWCYRDSSSYCAKYGRLYDWSTAMDIEEIYNGNIWGGGDTKHQGVCPSGWHLPSRTEWDQLVTTAGGSSTAGSKLKSTSGWNSNGNGTDEYGFSALPGGGRSPDGSFLAVGDFGVWWTATEGGDDEAYLRGMSYSYDFVDWEFDPKENGFSVRCLRD